MNDDIHRNYERETGAPYQRPPIVPMPGMGRGYRIVIVLLYVAGVAGIIGLFFSGVTF